jgi:hypothetical protein
MASDESLLLFAEVTGRLQLTGQHYVGVKPISVDRVIGSVDRSVDFDRLFRPRLSGLRARLGRYAMFPTGVVPAISTYEVDGWYFVIDGTIVSRWPISCRWNTSTPKSPPSLLLTPDTRR